MFRIIDHIAVHGLEHFSDLPAGLHAGCDQVFSVDSEVFEGETVSLLQYLSVEMTHLLKIIHFLLKAEITLGTGVRVLYLQIEGKQIRVFDS